MPVRDLGLNAAGTPTVTHEPAAEGRNGSPPSPSGRGNEGEGETAPFRDTIPDSNAARWFLPFSAETTPRVAALLAEAAAAQGEDARADTLLKAAWHADPHCLAVYFAFYKFYFYRGRLLEAERAALDGLTEAAAQGGFSDDWEQLHAGSADWTQASGPARFYLFSLKALAFIRLRRGRISEARVILARLAELDPADQVGGSVIRSLAAKIR